MRNTINLLFIADEEEIFVQLDETDKTTTELIEEGKDVLYDNGFESVRFVNFYTDEQAERLGLDTY